MKSLNLLAEQQDEMVRQNNIKAYKGLCMEEAALLFRRAKETEGNIRICLLAAAKEAMERVFHIDSLLT